MLLGAVSPNAEHLSERDKLLAGGAIVAVPAIPDIDTPPITPEPEPEPNSPEPSVDDVESMYSAESSDDEFAKRWSDLREENAQIRKAAARKEQLYHACYGSHVDQSPVITESREIFPHQSIKKLPVVDRISILKYVGHLKQKEKDAVGLARMFRSCNEQLQRSYMEYKSAAHKEREGVRYFWRQQVLEGGSRSGRMVRDALNKMRKSN